MALCIKNCEKCTSGMLYLQRLVNEPPDRLRFMKYSGRLVVIDAELWVTLFSWNGSTKWGGLEG